MLSWMPPSGSPPRSRTEVLDDMGLEDMSRVVRRSWVSIGSSSEEEYYNLHLRDKLLPPAALVRPRAPTPSAAVDPDIPLGPHIMDSPISDNLTDSPSSLAYNSPTFPPSPSPLVRSVSEGEQAFLSDQPQRAFARPPKSPKSTPLPDPSHFPDPYPFRPPHHHLTHTMPALSSAGSSSASTRSSAYTSSGSALASGDYGHVHVASVEDDSSVGLAGAVGISSDAVVQLLENDPIASSSFRGPPSRMPPDHSRWSETYSASSRSRSSSTGNSFENHPPPMPRLSQKPSFDIGWQAVDERDETGVSDEDTDDDPDDDAEEGEGAEEERTNAAVIADEGRGLIVQGDGLAISDLYVLPGTTHLIIGSSSTPNAMPGFLTTTIPQICSSLLALDISANFLGALPPCLSMCYNLEELNIASNPLRVLPVFLSGLTSLRVLIADATGISTVPDCFSDLDKLHTISVRRNKLHSLPSWFCLLPALTTLYVDGNPFQGPWKALVEPLLSQAPMTPMYPPSTPMFPKMSPGLDSTRTGSSPEGTDVEDLSDPSSPDSSGQMNGSPDEEQTITPERASFLTRTGTAMPNPPAARPLPPSAQSPPTPPPRSLQRTRTTPNRAFHESNRSKFVPGTPELPGQPPAVQDHKQFGEIRKMKSAGDLRRAKLLSPSSPDLLATPARPTIGSSFSTSNVTRTNPPASDRPGMGKRFVSLGPSAHGTPSRPPTGSRSVLTQSLWDGISETDDESPSSSSRVSFVSSHQAPLPLPSKLPLPEMRNVLEETSPIRARLPKDPKEVKEKGSRWGFLKKMSMGKMKQPEVVPRSSANKIGRPPLPRPHTSAGSPPGFGARSGRSSPTPRIDIRLSTANFSSLIMPADGPTPQPQNGLKPTSPDSLAVPNNLMVPPTSPMARTAKRRSFLPLDHPAPLQIPIPDASPFIAGITAANGTEDEPRVPTPSLLDLEEQARREEERARESYARALRSVMAYLRDMDDLGLSQQQSNAMSMYGSGTDEAIPTRSRRPTMSDGSRDVSMISTSDASGHLRSAEAMAGLRNGFSVQTLSVATTDSASSTDERKFKDDKGKRAMIIREIAVTERTYVKGLEELMDIYVKPGSAAVTMLSGVGSSKDTVVPMAERKIVFNGIDSLYSFHKDIFLPALEVAVAPLMRPAAELQQADADGQLSIEVAKTLASMFLKHAAFMRMYSSYINNFDAAVQRIKYWTSERPPAGNGSPASATSPASSTAHLAGIGMAISSISNPNASPDLAALTGVPNLTTSQRKRIRSYLKRCRVHPRHSQLNLEGYLLLPVQRVPRYRLLLEELLRSTPPSFDFMEDPLDKALAEISSLAINMNEGKREAESRRKLVQWQARIRGKFPSPLVQPHRRLIMDGPLLLTRVVRKAMVQFDAINAQGDTSAVQVDCLAPELTPRPLIGILCNDLLVLCRDTSEGHDPHAPVDLWAVLRMQTLPQPASIVHGNALRLVDNKAILYFDAPSPSDALNWYRAINLHIPASKS
ncbi:hypothetical protein HGRIS_007701 [Hohenbuehelia grisea]|uniref:DH domain-containing protein n=1 Tax=Hohenbuehelia grisea TaxID=104357 RepID=A0ABR3J5N0_9AGAR